jgi:hypothetical protein
MSLSGGVGSPTKSTFQIKGGAYGSPFFVTAVTIFPAGNFDEKQLPGGEMKYTNKGTGNGNN